MYKRAYNTPPVIKVSKGHIFYIDNTNTCIHRNFAWWRSTRKIHIPTPRPPTIVDRRKLPSTVDAVNGICIWDTAIYIDCCE